MPKQQSKIRKYRKPHNLNIGVIAFAFIFIYIFICVIIYFRSDKITGYEVKEGSLAVRNEYNAFAIRNEIVIHSEQSGYINYYVHDGERVAVDDLVYTVDENNTLSEMIQESSVTGTLSDTESENLRTKMLQQQKSLHEENFSMLYSYKRDMDSLLLKYTNYTMLNNIELLNSYANTEFLHYGYSGLSGVVTYYIDGYEEVNLETLTKECFDTDAYVPQRFYNNDIVNGQDPVYKVSMDETWYLVIPLTDQQVTELAEKTNVYVKFMNTQQQSYAAFSILTKADGTYGVLTLNDSMVQYVSERYIDVEIETEEENGLKIPVSSIVEKEFYVIPSEYITKGGKNGNDGVNKQIYTEDGKESVQFVEVTVYSAADGESYIDKISLRPGDVIIKPESIETHTISKMGTLIGVYNMNKGYADFKEITILYQNDEYAIIKPNTTYGLTVYDYIVLDASCVDEDDFIYN